MVIFNVVRVTIIDNDTMRVIFENGDVIEIHGQIEMIRMSNDKHCFIITVH